MKNLSVVFLLLILIGCAKEGFLKEDYNNLAYCYLENVGENGDVSSVAVPKDRQVMYNGRVSKYVDPGTGAGIEPGDYTIIYEADEGTKSIRLIVFGDPGEGKEYPVFLDGEEKVFENVIHVFACGEDSRLPLGEG